MTKKILFVLLAGMLILSACNTGTPTSTPTEVITEAVTETAVATEETTVDTEIISSLNIVPGESMPCATINNVEVPADYVQYQAVVEQLPEVSDGDWVKGNADAPVTIVEYADFQCSACSLILLT